MPGAHQERTNPVRAVGDHGLDPAEEAVRRRHISGRSVASWRGQIRPDADRNLQCGSDDQTLARAEGFRRMVEAGGHEWPDGWVKGMGFVRPREDADPMQPPPTVSAVGEEYIRQIVDLAPGQRKRYLDQVRILASVEVPSTRGAYRPFDQPVTSVHEADVKAWLIDWDRSLKTKANYHGLLYGVFNYALEQGFLTVNPCARTAPKRSRIRQSQADLRFLTGAS